MKVLGVTDEDFINYYQPCMYICMPFCTFKCDKESGGCYCQNSALAKAKPLQLNMTALIERYIANPITKAICFSGLEPFEQYDELIEFIRILRDEYHCGDTVIIYTGFYEHELTKEISELSKYKNIIVKFGRFIPNNNKHFDEVLGVYLASDNQYAKNIGV